MSRRTRHMLLLTLPLTLVAAVSGAAPGPLAGRWEGTLHGGRGDQPVAIVCRPRGASGFTGTFYMDGAELGPLENGTWSGDSLWFVVGSYACAARVDAKGMSVALTVTHGRTHTFDLTRTAADTTGMPTAASAPPPPSRDVAPDSVYRMHEVADGPASSTAACLRQGTLLLVGGGPSQEDIESRFRTLAGGDRARIVAIPTAGTTSSDPASMARFADAINRNLGVNGATVLHTFSRRQADSASFTARLEHATGVWIAGGEGSWLLDSYLGTRTEHEMIALLERGGVISGTSAGALIWGSRAMSFHARPGATEYSQMRLEDLAPNDVRSTGVGLLRNVVIVPHFSEHRLEPFLARLLLAHPGLLGLGIDEATAAEVHGDVLTVIGRGHVSVYDGRTNDGKPSATLAAGARYDVARRVTL